MNEKEDLLSGSDDEVDDNVDMGSMRSSHMLQSSKGDQSDDDQEQPDDVHTSRVDGQVMIAK